MISLSVKQNCLNKSFHKRQFFKSRFPNNRFIKNGNRLKLNVNASLQEVIVPVLLTVPGLCIAAYSLYRGKGNIRDGFWLFVDDISAGYLQPDVGGKNIPVADGKLSDLSGGDPLFIPLYNWFLKYGGVYKLSFGPKAFIVVSDPLVVKHLLKDNAFNYDKGVLAEILEPIMGKGLIPADLETWKPRRRAIVPAFHKAYLDAMIQMFVKCMREALEQLDSEINKNSFQNGHAIVNMEEVFLNFGLDVIGLGVFNYNFGSMKKQSPVIEAVYGVLKEAENRSTSYLPYWDLPFASVIFPDQRAFRKDLKVINDCLDDLIRQARSMATEADLEALQNRDYSKVSDPSLLRFLVDLRGEDASDKQLRDDLMTMLIAGHETTAAVLTWALFLVCKNPQFKKKLLAEVDSVIEDGYQGEFGLEQIKALPLVRKTLAESLRLYPQPPILIRRALAGDVLPQGLNGVEGGYPIGRGADIFISTWNLHRSPQLWDDPDDFNPERFSQTFVGRQETFENKWDGYTPSDDALYPNEVQSNFGFVPFGGGIRKCVGDQFAMFEATVSFALLLKEFEFEFKGDWKDVGMATGATIHTRNGLYMRVTKRKQGTAIVEQRERRGVEEGTLV